MWRKKEQRLQGVAGEEAQAAGEQSGDQAAEEHLLGQRVHDQREVAGNAVGRADHDAATGEFAGRDRLERGVAQAGGDDEHQSGPGVVANWPGPQSDRG